MNFEEYAPQANAFVKDVALELGMPQETATAYRIMKSVLHAVRELITTEESLHLISQLPLIIKGVYVEDWHISPDYKIRSMQEFLKCLRRQNAPQSNHDFEDEESTLQYVKGVLNVLKAHITTGEFQDILDQFPMELAGLWLTEEKQSH